MNEKANKAYKTFRDKCNAVHREQLMARSIYVAKDKRSQISNLKDMYACLWVYENRSLLTLNRAKYKQ